MYFKHFPEKEEILKLIYLQEREKDRADRLLNDKNRKLENFEALLNTGIYERILQSRGYVKQPLENSQG